MKNLNLTAFALTLIMTGCMTYQPQTIDIPLINKKNDLRLDAGMADWPHATISYGLTDKFAIQAFGSRGNDGDYFLHGALGYYKNLGNQKVFEIYSGYDFGRAHHESKRFFWGNDEYIQGHHKICFVQFNIGKTNCHFANMDYGLGFKTGYMYSEIYDFGRSTANNLLIEPLFFIRFGGERLKFNIKLGTCWLAKLNSEDKKFPYSSGNLGIGINYRLRK